jgi:PAS domain S-box-containing protein
VNVRREAHVAPSSRASTDELLLDGLFAAAPVGLGFLDRDLRYRRINEALARTNGRTREEHLGRRPSELLGDLGLQAEALLERVMATREPIVDSEFALPDGRHLILSFVVVEREDGEVIGTLAVVSDVTPRKVAELDLARALDHSTRLHQVATSLSAALTVDEVAGVVVRASMDVLGGTCGVLGQRESGRLEVRHRFGMAGVPPSVIGLDARLPMPEAVRTRKIVTLASRDAWRTRFPDAPPRGDFEGFVAVPLVFEGRATGCMGIGLADRRTPDDQELALLGAVARQGAQALERARLYEERAYIAATLQRGLLPPRLPEPAGLDIAVSYRPVGDGSQVGGDFYDVVDLGEDGWMAAVGDVAGKGVTAAVLSGLVRTTLGAVAQRQDRPADILAMANRAVLRHSSARTEYATAVCAILTRDERGIAASVGSAGHPPALVVRAAGGLEVLEVGGVLLGVSPDLEVGEIVVRLEPGDALVLHTDGVTDARNDRERFGEARLQDLLRAMAGEPAAAIAGAVDSAVRAFGVGPPADDAALMVLRAL